VTAALVVGVAALVAYLIFVAIDVNAMNVAVKRYDAKKGRK
jgi:hypothetical protein